MPCQIISCYPTSAPKDERRNTGRATWLLGNGGVDVRYIQHLLGHTSSLDDAVLDAVSDKQHRRL
jgi:integrase